MEAMLNQDTRSSKDGSSYGSEVDTDVEDAVEVGLAARKQRPQFSGVVVPVLTKVDNNEGEPLENIAYLDKYGGAIEDLNIQKFLNSDASNNGETETTVNAGRDATKAKSKQIEEEIIEEEVVELEFEKAKRHTHTMHCPHCDEQITRVILRRKIISNRPRMTTEQPPITKQKDEPLDLLGCLSCFSLFTCTDDGGCNPFRIPWGKPTSGDSRGDGDGVVREDGNCFSIFRVFTRNPGKFDKDFEQPKPGKVDHDPSLSIQKEETSGPDVKEKPLVYQPPSIGVPSHYEQVPHGEDETSIHIPPYTSPATQVDPLAGSAAQDSTSFEILKSIVYGGLMEVIASLSIVASAAAGDTTTLSIIALALANLVGGIFIIGHNLWNLKDDCYKFSTQQINNNHEARNKYEELLGPVEHFPLHAFFAILSFLVFGIIPPMVYGYSFNETNDKDFTMVIVAVASFVCVAMLAIFKAYVDRCTRFWGYVKIIMYYLTTAVTVSGVSYAAGNLAKKLIEELGLFATSSNIAMSMNPSLAYY